MYLVPWQIFVLGCICGICISVFVLCVLLVRLAFKNGVKVEKVKEEDKDGRR